MRVCVVSDLPAASSLSENNKTTVRETERGKPASSVVHTINVHGGAGNYSVRKNTAVKAVL